MATVDPAVVTIKVTQAKPDDSQGSGFVVSPRGIILTNYHVIEGAKSARVMFRDKTSFNVEGYLAISPGKDMALIQIDPGSKELKTLVLADQPPARGERVYAFGAPLGLSDSVSDGLVSALREGEDVRSTFKDSYKKDFYRDILGYELDARWIQTTAPISPGNSGGPLVNSRGQVVGLNTWRLPQGESLNFAISIAHVAQLAAKDAPSSLATLPPPRENVRLATKGDPEKSLEFWKQVGGLKSGLKKKTKSIQAKLDKHRIPANPANPNAGRNRRVELMSKDYTALAETYLEYAEAIKSLPNKGVDLELLVVTAIDADLARRAAEAYQHFSRAVQTYTSEHPLESEFRLRSAKEGEMRLSTAYNILRLELGTKYDQQFPSMESVDKSIESE
jgi:hypothetical protein